MDRRIEGYEGRTEMRSFVEHCWYVFSFFFFFLSGVIRLMALVWARDLEAAERIGLDLFRIGLRMFRQDLDQQRNSRPCKSGSTSK